MNYRMRDILRVILLIVLPIIIVVGLNYTIYSLKNIDFSSFVKTTTLLATICGVSSVFYLFHKFKLTVVNHALVVLLGAGLAFIKTSNLGEIEMKFISLLTLYIVHFAIMDGITYLTCKKAELIRLRNAIFVLGGIVAYSSAMILSLLVQGVGLEASSVRAIFMEAFNIYIFVGLSFGIGLLVYDQSEKR